MCHRQYHLRAPGFRKGDEHPTYAPVEYGTFCFFIEYLEPIGYTNKLEGYDSRQPTGRPVLRTAAEHQELSASLDTECSSNDGE